MSSGSELFPFGATAQSGPAFELALRGYDKRQVDKYVQQVEADIALLMVEREDAYTQIAELTHAVARLEQELSGMRRFMASSEAVSYRHLGARVEQILTLAEEQAADIRAQAAREISDRDDIVKARAEIDAETADTARDFEMALTARRAEEERAAVKRRQDVATEVEVAKAYAAKLRSDAEMIYESARQESIRVGEATKSYAAKVRADTEEYASRVRTQLAADVELRRGELNQDLAALRADAMAQLERDIAREREEAEAQLYDLKIDVQRYADSAAQARLSLDQTDTRVQEILDEARRKALAITQAAEEDAATATTAAATTARQVAAAAAEQAQQITAKATAQAEQITVEATARAEQITTAATAAAAATKADAQAAADLILAEAEALLDEVRTAANNTTASGPNQGTAGDHAIVTLPAQPKPTDVVDAEQSDAGIQLSTLDIIPGDVDGGDPDGVDAGATDGADHGDRSTMDDAAEPVVVPGPPLLSASLDDPARGDDGEHVNEPVASGAAR